MITGGNNSVTPYDTVYIGTVSDKIEIKTKDVYIGNKDNYMYVGNKDIIINLGNKQFSILDLFNKLETLEKENDEIRKVLNDVIDYTPGGERYKDVKQHFEKNV